jgi:hypothetical protein
VGSLEHADLWNSRAQELKNFAGNLSSASSAAGNILLGVLDDPEGSHLGSLHEGGIDALRSPKYWLLIGGLKSSKTLSTI